MEPVVNCKFVFKADLMRCFLNHFSDFLPGENLINLSNILNS